MAQATMTVRTDAALKATFDSLCADFGMSANTAMNIFMRAVAETRSIPFRIGKRENIEEQKLQEKQQARSEFKKLLDAIRMDTEIDRPEISLEEINAEIAAYRAERRARQEKDTVAI